ncbi:hypothetical protein GCM10027521_29680 [Amycolatopsis cihanbeyliensis]
MAVHNDDVNTVPVVVHLFQALCGMPPQDAARAVAEVHQEGKAEVGMFADQLGAEQFAVRLQRYGLHATVRPA